MSRSRRAPRGNGLYENPDSDAAEENPEDAIAIVDDEGNPIDDDFAFSTDEPTLTTETSETEEVEDDPHAVLERNYNELQQKHQTVTQERDTFKQQAESSRTGEVEATKATIAQAKASTQAKIDAASRAIEEAGEAQDYKALAQAQSDLADAKYDLRDIGNIEKQFEAGLEEQSQRREAPKASDDQPHDKKVNAWIETLPENAQKFAKKHRGSLFPEGDPKPLNKAMAAWNYARDVKGLEPGSDDFYDYIERETGLTEQTKKPAPKPAPQRRPNAAPVRRGTPTSSAQVHLSQAELNMAKRLGMSPKKYALNKHTAMTGAKDPDYSGPRYSKDDPAIVGSNT